MPLKEAQERITKQLGNSKKDKSMRHVILNNFVQRPNGFGWRTDVPAIVNYLRHWINFPVVPGRNFAGPTLFIRGGDSQYIPETDHRQILEFFPNAEVQTIEGAGHFLHLQKPKEFRRVCLEFLNVC
uniref:sn-1-specific diacylglycerol lipase ABHD11 n=2 Tax=Photinus pyralis TaxID=7054 RepID=A0A1Y1M831_PHOPY